LHCCENLDAIPTGYVGDYGTIHNPHTAYWEG